MHGPESNAVGMSNIIPRSELGQIRGYPSSYKKTLGNSSPFQISCISKVDEENIDLDESIQKMILRMDHLKRNKEDKAYLDSVQKAKRGKL